MFRAGTILAVFLALSAWAGAQGPQPTITAADQIRLLRANRGLIADLVDGGIRIGTSDHPLKRAEACQSTAHALGVAVQRAAEAQDADRVNELADHLEVVVREGLVPNLDEAKGIIPAESPDAARLKEVRARAVLDLDEVRSAIPTTGKFGDPTRANEMRGKLERLRDRLK